MFILNLWYLFWIFCIRRGTLTWTLTLKHLEGAALSQHLVQAAQAFSMGLSFCLVIIACIFIYICVFMSVIQWAFKKNHKVCIFVAACKHVHVCDLIEKLHFLKIPFTKFENSWRKESTSNSPSYLNIWFGTWLRVGSRTWFANDWLIWALWSTSTRSFEQLCIKMVSLVMVPSPCVSCFVVVVLFYFIPRQGFSV